MKNSILLYSLLFLNINVFSQSDKYFIKVIGKPFPMNESASIVKQLSDGTYILGSNHWTGNNGNIQLIHLNKFGNILFDTTYWDSSKSIGIRDLQVSKKCDTYIITAAYLNPANNKFDSYIAKIDTTGKILWEKTVGDTTSDNGPYSIKPTIDGGYILAGYWVDSASYWDANVIILDSVGNVQWDTTLGKYGRNDAFDWVEQTPDSGFVFFGDYDYLFDTGWGWMVKIDKNRKVIMDKKFSVDATTYVTNFRVTKDGGYIICGEAGPDIVEYTYILKQSANGNQEWVTNITDPLTNLRSSPSRISQLSDGNYILSGTISLNFNRWDVLISKIDNTGIELWRRMYGNSPTFDDGGGDIITTSDGGFIFAGQTLTAYDANIYVIKTNCAGFAGPPLAKFNTIENAKSVFFANRSDSAVSYKWYFGDGDSSVYDFDKSWIWIRHVAPDTFTHIYQDTGTYTVTLLAGACGEYDTLEQQITVLATSIETKDLIKPEFEVKVIPNPFTDFIVIEYLAQGTKLFELYDLTGRKKTAVNLNVPFVGTQTWAVVRSINVFNLPQGVYIYRIVNENGSVRRGKMVKQ